MPLLIQIYPNSTIIVNVTVRFDLAALNHQLFFTIVEQIIITIKPICEVTAKKSVIK